MPMYHFVLRMLVEKTGNKFRIRQKISYLQRRKSEYFAAQTYCFIFIFAFLFPMYHKIEDDFGMIHFPKIIHDHRLSSSFVENGEEHQYSNRIFFHIRTSFLSKPRNCWYKKVRGLVQLSCFVNMSAETVSLNVAIPSNFTSILLLSLFVSINSPSIPFKDPDMIRTRSPFS